MMTDVLIARPLRLPYSGRPRDKRFRLLLATKVVLVGAVVVV